MRCPSAETRTDRPPTARPRPSSSRACPGAGGREHAGDGLFHEVATDLVLDAVQARGVPKTGLALGAGQHDAHAHVV